MKAVLHYRAGPALQERLRALGTVNVVIVDETDDDGFRREIADADVLLHVLKPVTAEMIKAAPRLRLIQKIGVGLNTIDRGAAAARGVKVANMPGTNSRAVAEHALMLMLAVLRQVVRLDTASRASIGWKLPPEMLERSGEIGGRIVGLVGYGAVPRHLAPVLQALGAYVIHYDLAPGADSLPGFRSLDALLAESDIVSLHIPLTTKTHGLFGTQSLAKMKRGAVLINTARGELVDETALATALQNGTLLGAGLDVFATEPADANNRLLHLPNVVATPHVAWLTPETLQRSIAVILENVRRLQDGEPLLHEAHPP